MKIGYILCYYFPQYVRTKTLVSGLENIPGIELTKYINKNTGFIRYVEVLFQIFRMRIFDNPDVYFLGFRGYEIYWPVRLITWGKPLILDHMMSPYDSLVFEKKSIRKGSVLEKIFFQYERGIMKSADVVLTDTWMHQQYFTELFDLPPDKIVPIHVSTDEKLFYPRPKNKSQTKFVVFFYGSFLPLHGVSHILEAAHLVRDLPIRFHLVGGHKLDLTAFHQQIEVLDLTNVIHTPWIDYQQLPSIIANADLCLGGPFGDTGQARRVITGKTYQFLAMQKPTIIGITEDGLGFLDKENCFLVHQADAEELARAIRWAFNHPGELDEIASRGRELFHNTFSNQKISEDIKKVINEIFSS